MSESPRLHTQRIQWGARDAVALLMALRVWCFRSHPVSVVVLGVGVILSLVGLGFSSVKLARRELTPESALLIVGMIFLLVAAALQVVRTRARIEGLESTIRDKDGYRHFVDHAAEGFFRTDPEGAVLEVNAALAHIFGYDSQQDLRAALNHHPQDLYLDLGRREEFWSQLRTQERVDEFISKVRRRRRQDHLDHRKRSRSS